MKTVLIGTDFCYNIEGALKPIEINTNIGVSPYALEDEDNMWDLANLQLFVSEKQFTKLIYIGPPTQRVLRNKLQETCTNLSIEFEFISVSDNAITIPYVEDNETTLIIRSSYDATALVDEEYCKNKVNFLDLIKNTSFKSQFAYKTEDGSLVNYISSIPDNGEHPNFILKSVLPHYNKESYPKLYKVTNQAELDVILENVSKDYFLMEYHFNPSKLYNGLIKKIRKVSLLYPPNLESITLSHVTDLPARKTTNLITYNPETFELNSVYRSIYITDKFPINLPKLMDDDYVVMADGTRKSGLDLQVGDIIKTIEIPNPDGADIADPTVNFGVNIDTFITGVTYSTNSVTMKARVESFVKVVTINFSDNTTWMDTANSSYLVYSDNEVKFKFIDEFVVGDVVLLIDTNDLNTPQIIQKTVTSVVHTKDIFEGWLITVDRTHLFLTATDGPNNISPSFVAIEHNLYCKGPGMCPPYTYCYNGKCIAY